MKKLLTSLLCVVMMVTFMPSMAFATGSEELSGEPTPPTTMEETQNGEIGGNEDNTNDVTVATVTIGDQSEEFTTLDAAIAAANAKDGEMPITVEIVTSGNYKGFQLTRDNITVKAKDGVEAVFVKPETSYDRPYGGAVSIGGENSVLKNLTFKCEEYTEWSFVHVKDDTTFESCKFIGDDKAGTALMYNQKGSTKGAPIALTVNNCIFENFSEGIRTCGDSTQLGKFTLTNNHFKDVLYSINVYFGCGNDTSEPNLIISGNTFDSGKYETSYVHFWDYVQLQQFYGNKDSFNRTGTALNVKMEDNTYIGDVRVTATHCDWYTDTPIEVDEATEERMVYRHLVELNGAESATLTNADGSAIPETGGDLREWNETQTKDGKTYIYAISEGDYILNVKFDENSDVVSMPLKVKPQTPGETQNKIELTDEDKYVASVGDKKYTSVQDAVNNADSGEKITLLKSIALGETGITIDGQTVNLDLNGKTLSAPNKTITVKNGSLNVTGKGIIKENSPYYAPVYIAHPTESATQVTVTIGKDVTLEGWSGVFISDSSKCNGKNVTVTVNGTINSVRDTAGDAGHGIYINGNINNTTDYPTITLGADSVINSAGNGIYAAGFAKWNLQGDITAEADALSVKSGIFNISSGTYHSKGAFANPAVGNSNGSENTGAALSITSNEDYADKLDITVTGGTFISDNGHAVYEGIATKDNAPMAPASYATLEITGGTFTSGGGKTAVNITKATDKKVISGGTFSTEVADTFLVSGMDTYKMHGGSFTVGVITPEGELPSIENTPGYHWEEDANGNFVEVKNPTPVIPSVQKPTIEVDEHATVTLSAYGTIATIKVAEGYEIADVTVNGVSKGKVDMIYGLKTGDVLKVTTVKKGETEAEKNARLKAGVENTTIKLKSTLGKGYIKLNWTKSEGYKVDKYQVFRSTKRYSGYGTKAYFTTKQGGLKAWYKNTKELKKGNRYYYKVRGVREIANETVYTQWSNKAWRLVK